MVAAIYGDRKDLLARESMGQMYVFFTYQNPTRTRTNTFYSTNDAASVFSQKLVDDLMNRPSWKLTNPPKYIFLGVDPVRQFSLISVTFLLH